MRHPMVPDAVPVLSPGRHRTPRKGACFMEFASYLAGEPWSDHPGCTHPALAALARGVNDSVSDGSRRELVSLIPEVVGLNGGDRSLDLWIALRCAHVALPVASETRQNVLALAVLKAEEELALLEGRDAGLVSQESRRVLAEVPGAHRWALNYLGTLRARSAPQTNVAVVLENAVLGISQSVSPGADAMLVGLLRECIGHCRELLAEEAASIAGQPVRAAATSRG